MYIADLHIHSHYSRATSKSCTPEHLDMWARRKGISIVGTGDFTHPGWRQELRDKLEPTGSGLYTLKEEYRIPDPAAGGPQPHFLVTGEISSIYKKNGRVRKVHSLIMLPGLEDAERVARKLETLGNLHSDGRPILGLDCRDLLEILLELSPKAVYVPAHIWTPHFSLFGAFSGFDSIEECFGSLSSEIHALETGLSSDPPMNWRVSALDRFRLISNSDAHSPQKLGREANLLDTELSYDGMKRAVERGEGLAGTIEFFPEEGKYHYDGHRKCGLCLSPAETERYGGVCPVCGGKLTVGVSHRIEQLSDRPEGCCKDGAAGFERLVPLMELIGACLGCSPASGRAGRVYEEMLRKLGAEFTILRELPMEEISRVSGRLIAEGIGRLRRGEADWRPGFDGEYGRLRLFTPGEIQRLSGQTSLFEETADAAGERPIQQKGPQEGKSPAGPGPDAAGHAVPAVRERIWNQRQQEAIQSIHRVTVVKAGPGTGKTGTLAARILHLVETRRVPPSRITAVTFTNQAAGELRERIGGQLGRAAQKVQIGSFHGLARKFLKSRGRVFSLAGETETWAIAAGIRKEYGLKQTEARLLDQISRWRTGTKAPAPGQEERALAAYQAALEEWGALDFDGLLLETLRLLEEEAGDTGEGPFSYLLVDEFQDVSPLQYRLVQAWNRGGRELFVIGDRDQAIYGFRGADARCFQKLEEDFPQAHSIVLEMNYRSTPQILAAASAVISSGPGGSRALKPCCPEGPPVRVVEAGSEREEAIFTAKEINRLVGGIGMLEAQEMSPARDGSAWGFEDIAVLYRTHRQAALLEECLAREGIPYVVAGREPFLQEESVREAVCFFKAISRPEDRLAAMTARALLGDRPGLYEAMAEKYAPQLQRKRPHTLLEDWARGRGLENKKEMEQLIQASVLYRRMGDLLEALDTGVESDLKRCGGKRYTAGAVTLMTLHGAKGLEFPVVLIYGARRGLIPFSGGKGSSSEEEERRLFYVGLTRAREVLAITTSKEPSSFLQALSPGLARWEKARAGQGWEQGRQMIISDYSVTRKEDADAVP